MAGAYRPRPTEVRVCQNCGVDFETRHKRTIYCGSSCRVLAFNARHRLETSNKSAKGQLDFSLQNVGTIAVGSGITAGANYLLNDRPAHREVIDKLDRIEELVNVGESSSSVQENLAYLVDYVKIVVSSDYNLVTKMAELKTKREQQKLKGANKEQQMRALLEKRKNERRGRL